MSVVVVVVFVELVWFFERMLVGTALLAVSVALRTTLHFSPQGRRMRQR
jgi:hypothetical protein